jgi:hypothetical protein
MVIGSRNYERVLLNRSRTVPWIFFALILWFSCLQISLVILVWTFESGSRRTKYLANSEAVDPELRKPKNGYINLYTHHFPISLKRKRT